MHQSTRATKNCDRSKISFAMLLLAIANVSSVFGVTNYYYVGASNDWWNAASYSTEQGGSPDSVMPAAEDILILTQGQTVYVDDTTISFFSTISRVAIMGSNVRAYFNLTTNANLNCYFGDLSMRSFTNSVIVKEGPGRLTLAKPGTVNDHVGGSNASHYNIGFDIRQGDVVLEPLIGSSYRHWYGDVTVGEGCTLYGVEGGTMWLQSLAGAGMVTNRVTEGSQLTVTGVRDCPTVFSGVIGGFKTFNPQGHTYYTGTGNTTGNSLKPAGYTGSGTVGITGFATLAGAATQPSSLGMGTLDCRNPAYMLYLGSTGETIERNCSIWNTKTAPFVWDAGAHGGLVFTGNFAASGLEGCQQRLVLTGSNTVTCILSNSFTRGHVSPPGSSFFIAKKGLGTWRFAEPPGGTTLSGVIGVEEGALEFDTLRDAGLKSALGYATELYEDKCENVTNDITAVDYAHVLGGDSTTGTFRYLGEVSRVIENRPLALKGAGRIEAPNCAVLKWKGVTGVGAGEKSLSITCAEGQTNHFANITDGEGVVSIAKVGPGDLVLTGELSFGGDLSATGGGTLTVRDISNAQYRYYKLTLKETVGTSTNAAYSDFNVIYNDNSSANGNTRFVGLNEFALYNDAGARQNTHNSESALAESTAQLGPGQIALEYVDDLVHTTNNSRDYRAWRLLDAGNSGGTHLCVRWKDMTKAPRYGEPNTWISAVMRLKENADAITRYDINFYSYRDENNFIRNITAFSISASADGLNYEELVSTNDIINTATTYYTWLSDGTVGANSTSNAKLPLPHSSMQAAYNVLNKVRSISADAGSTLKFEGSTAPVVSGLKVDAAGMGAIDGFAFAAKGALTIRNFPANTQSLAIPADFRNAAELANVAKWDLEVFDGDGCAVGHFHISSVSASSIVVSKPGFTMILR